MNSIEKIKVTLVYISRFHHFDLARELLKRNMLQRIITGCHRWKLSDGGISTDRFSTFPWLQTPHMALCKWCLLKEGHIQKGIDLKANTEENGYHFQRI